MTRFSYRHHKQREAIHLVVTLLVLTLSLLVFLELGTIARLEEVTGFDRSILLAFRTPGDPDDPIGPDWLEEGMRDVTSLGSMTCLGLLSMLAALFLLADRKPRTALALVAVVGCGTILSTVLKAGFERVRPDLVPHGNEVFTSSFPSGHSMLSAVVYLSVAALLARSRPETRIRLFLFLVAAALTVLIGVSRIYLGVHWPTDVLAGWLAGFSWALVCYAVIMTLQLRRQIESPQTPTGSD